MARRIIMPKTGMAMEEGTIVRWLKKEGDTLRAGEPIAEIETDKVTMDLEAEADGVLLKIVRADGETVPVTETIAWLGAQGESVEGEAPSVRASRPAPAPTSQAPAPSAGPVSPGRTVPATPAARRLASERGVELRSVSGSGPFGAVRVRDLEKAAPRPTPQVPSYAFAAVLHCRADVTALAALIERLNAAGGTGLTVIDFVRKASRLALPALGPGTSGETFGIIDLGSYGVSSFTPPLEPPRTAVLGVGRIEDSLRLSQGRLEERRMLAVSFTHGLGPAGTLPAAAFLSRLRMLLENPAALLV